MWKVAMWRFKCSLSDFNIILLVTIYSIPITLYHSSLDGFYRYIIIWNMYFNIVNTYIITNHNDLIFLFFLTKYSLIIISAFIAYKYDQKTLTRLHRWHYTFLNGKIFTALSCMLNNFFIYGDPNENFGILFS